MITTAEPGAGTARGAALLALALLGGCGPETPPPGAAPEGWSLTAWGEHFEVFPEVDALIAGETALAHVHVTRLEEFAPLAEGRLEIRLSSPGGEAVFTAEAPARPGVFPVEIEPTRAGEFELSFSISAAGIAEEVRGGRVRVGSAESPGGLLVAPAPRGGSDDVEPLPFLKEEQWRSDFATTWVRSGSLPRGASGLATVRPRAGDEFVLTAPVDGVLRPPAGSASWPWVGRSVARDEPLFQVVPHVAPERSLAALEAELAALEAELAPARARLERLEGLWRLEATSRREIDEARARLEGLEARRSAAARDLEAARSSRQGGSAEALTLRAPIGGRVAEVSGSPGATVAAGGALARLVGTDVVWIEVALPPAAARTIEDGGVAGVVLTAPERQPIRLGDEVRLVSIAPEISRRTGTRSLLLETGAVEGLTLGTTLQATILTRQRMEGIVIPASALVDDGGVAVVYLQLSGESFARQEIEVLERQGDLLLVDRLIPGQRLVSRGGEAIRRASLMATGEAHGHVH